MEEIQELRATIDRMLQEQVKVSQHVSTIIEQMKVLNNRVKNLENAPGNIVFGNTVKELLKISAGPSDNRE